MRSRCEYQTGNLVKEDGAPGDSGEGSCGGFQALGVSHHAWAGGAGCAVSLE